MRQSSRVSPAVKAGIILAGLFVGAAGWAEVGWGEGPDDEGGRAIAAVEAYHQALAGGDSAAAHNLLAEDAMVLESGYAETLEEYLGHHLGADMEFASQVSSQRSVLKATMEGNVAWVSSSSETEGELRGEPFRAAGVELMVLSKQDGNWKIRAIHWSSHRLDPE